MQLAGVDKRMSPRSSKQILTDAKYYKSIKRH